MMITRSAAFQSLLAVLALTFFQPWCPRTKAADREVSIPGSSFPQSMFEISLHPRESFQCLDRMAPTINPRKNVCAGLMPYGVPMTMWGNWVTEIMNKSETWLNNRTHMIQFCAIGMVIALIIIWWRKT